MTLSPGAQLGQFKLQSAIGKGGMGEVYRATDTRLNRDVAIKILPADVAGDGERLVRFEREARLLAALNHPNIAHVYGFERGALSDGTPINFLAMEFVAGEDVAQRLERGRISVDESIAIARQVADALEEAHEAGIVHRDLKPANIRLTPDGKVKVLDFGLAKAQAGDSSRSAAVDLSHSPTFAATQTQAGVILGTAAYMSPEQVRGKPLDKRSDIWAFGAVLYEMLSGRRLFSGDTVSDLLAAVLRADLNWDALPPDTPPRLRALIRRCLERDPKRRLRDIGEARVTLEDLAAGSDSAAPVAPAVGAAPRRGALWPWLIGLAVVALAGLAVGRYVATPSAARPRPIRFEIRAGDVLSAVLSPDGTQLAIVAEGHLWVRDLARLENRALEQTDGAIRPFWSPDGGTIAYGAKGKLWKVAAAGGVPAAICDLASGLWDNDAGGAWLADGTIVYSDGNVTLWRVSSQGGDPVELLKPNPARELHFHTVNVLPDGRSIVYVVHRAGQGVGDNTLAVWSNGQAHDILELPGQSLDDPVYSSSGHILFHRSPANAGIWALPFSMKTLKAEGEPFVVAQGMVRPSIASDGTLVMLPPRRQRPLNLAWTDRDGKILSRVDEPRLRQPNAAISPDGDRVAVAERADGKSDIWQYDLKRNTRSRLTQDGSAAEPSWLLDGRSLLYAGRPQNGQGIVVKRVTADGSGRAEEFGPGRRPTATPDGATAFFVLPDQDGQRLWYRSLTARDAKPAHFMDQAFYGIPDVAASPDGRLVAYSADRGPGQSDVFIRRFPPSEGVWQVSTSGGSSPRWSRDGHLYFSKGADIFEVEIASSPDVHVGTPVPLFKRTSSAGSEPVAAFDVSPDGKHFLIYEPVGDPSEQGISVVLHWFSDFAR